MSEYEILGYEPDSTSEDYQILGVDPGAQYQFNTDPGTAGNLGVSFLEAANAMPGMKEVASGVNAGIDALTGKQGFSDAYNQYRDKWNQAIGASQEIGARGP